MLSLKEGYPYGSESTRMVQGITFHLPSRRRFIPYSWLLFSELNREETELQLHYTHSVVTVTGTKLHFLHECVEQSQLKAVREMISLATGQSTDATVTRIDITEKMDD